MLWVAGKVSLGPGAMVFEWSEGLKLSKRRQNCFCVQVRGVGPYWQRVALVDSHSNTAWLTQSATSRRLICQAGSSQERAEWMEALLVHINGQRPK